MSVLQTERLTLRLLVVSDAAFVLELLNDVAFIRYIGDRGVRTVEEAEAYVLNGPMAMYERCGHGLLVVELRGVPIGICGLIKRDVLPDVDIGFAFLPLFRGAGYAFEAASAVLDYGRSELRLRRIVAVCSPENEASIRLLGRLGLRREGVARLVEDGEELALFAWEISTREVV